MSPHRTIDKTLSIHTIYTLAAMHLLLCMYVHTENKRSLSALAQAHTLTSYTLLYYKILFNYFTAAC